MTQHYSILVNTSDGFEDCWIPFFKLFSIYWRDCNAPILLNTEKKNWSFHGLDIKCTQVQLGRTDRRLTWSECLLEALNRVETPLVLYLQEDYFIEKSVNCKLIDEFAGIMANNKAIKHIGLTHFGSMGEFERTEDPRLWKISQKAPYRISTQAGLWRVDSLKSYLRPEENGWMFEIFGTMRARHRHETFLTANRDIYSSVVTPIVQYTHTGIIKGKWHPEMPALFEAHGIEVDFQKRGFFKPKPRLIEKLHTLKKIISRPSALLNGLRGI